LTSKPDLHLFVLKYVFEFEKVAFELLIINILNIFTSLMPSIVKVICAAKRLHAPLVQRVSLTKLVNPKFIPACFSVHHGKIKPLPQTSSIGIFPHKDPKLPGGLSSSYRQIPTLKFSIKAQLKLPS
jgi:hypothetical protein